MPLGVINMFSNDILQNPWDIFDCIDEETKQEFELSDILVDIACKIINYRLDNNLTQKELADKLEITQAMVSKLESGEYNPSIGFLFKIARKLGWKFQLIFEENYVEQVLQYDIPEQEQLVNESSEDIDKNLELLKGYAA